MQPRVAARRRTVWALLSDGERWTIRDLAATLGVALDTVQNDLAWLAGAGYIERPVKRGTGVRVLIPLGRQ